jgi:Na+-transporting methylmalonyl-CoA/oxaloacetate decarboxylase gamma subunit
MTLLDKLADPNLLEQMTTSEKLSASFQATVLGMGITFSALVIIWGVSILLKNAVLSIEGKKDSGVKVVNTPQKKTQAVSEVVEEDATDDEELIAVISAAIASSMDTSVRNIVVKNIVRVNDDTPTWGKVARIDQVNSRLY